MQLEDALETLWASVLVFLKGQNVNQTLGDWWICNSLFCKNLYIYNNKNKLELKENIPKEKLEKNK